MRKTTTLCLAAAGAIVVICGLGVAPVFAATVPATTTTTIATLADVSGSATVSASSQNVSTGQLAVKAVDGVVDGYPGDYTKEWATTGGKAGSSLQLDWASPVTLSKIVLYDRPNADDQITAGTITFSDGTTLSTGALANDGSAVVLTFVPRTTTSLLVSIDQVSPTTVNVGLADIEAWGIAAPAGGPAVTTTTTTTVPPTTTTTVPPTTTTTVPPTTTTTLPPTTTTTLPPTTTTTLPPTTTTTVPATTTTTIATLADVSGSATVSASSQNVSTGQLAVKAVDGVVDGYPGDYTKEWATTGGKAGSSLQLDWASPVTLSKIVLYDRPNADDQITAGTITFSDGTTLSTGALANDGSAVVLTFVPRTTTSLLVSIDQVSPTTVNVGLADIEAWGIAAPAGGPAVTTTTTTTVPPTTTTTLPPTTTTTLPPTTTSTSVPPTTTSTTVPPSTTSTTVPPFTTTTTVPRSFNLQSAIDATPAGGTVTIPAGTITISSSVRLKSGVSLQGAGIDKTVLSMPSQSSDTGFLVGKGVSNVAVRDLTLTSPTASGYVYALWFSSYSGVTIERVKVTNCMYGLKADTQGSNLTVRDFTVLACGMDYISNLTTGLFERLDLEVLTQQVTANTSHALYLEGNNHGLTFNTLKARGGSGWTVQLYQESGLDSDGISFDGLDVTGWPIVISYGFSNVQIRNLTTVAQSGPVVEFYGGSNVTVNDFTASGGSSLTGWEYNQPTDVTFANGTYAGATLGSIPSATWTNVNLVR